MSKEKSLLKNLGILTIGKASVKFLGFILVPLYTNILSTYDFGVYELVMTTINLLLPIVTLDISDATLRFTMEPGSDKNDVYRISIKYCMVGLVLVITMIFLNRILVFADFLFGNEVIFILIFICIALVNVYVSYAKGIDRIKDTVISGVLGALVTILLNIVLLVPMKMGVKGYFIATIAGYAVQVIYYSIKLRKIHGSAWQIKDKGLEHSLIRYSIPLIANNTAWWVNSALDRYIVTFFCGISENGVYSVGYKIPTIINAAQSLFHQAWTISAIQEYNDDEACKYFARMYKNYNCLLVLVCSILTLINKPLSRIMYAKDFYGAWRYTPFLCVGFVFLGLANYIGGIFNALKKPRIIATTTILGATVNIVLNLLLIPIVGALGAALATCISYLVIWFIRMIVIKRHIEVHFFSARDIMAYIMLGIASLSTIYENKMNVGLEVGIMLAIVIMYSNEVHALLRHVYQVKG